MHAICRTCLHAFDMPGRCPACRSPRVLRHPELHDLGIAHMDCDAFYAAVEKRDNPDLADVPLIVGGSERGVVTTACYIARIRGVRSAMPMYQALRLCPEATVIRPRFEVYARVSREIRTLMDTLTPVVEPLSLDEAFLDLTGTARLHGASPAVMLSRLVSRIEDMIGITVSIGLSHNKFLAKIASDLDKPKGFSVIGRAETQDFLTDKPVGLIWGVGGVTRAALGKAGIRTFADLRRWDRRDLHRRFGGMGERLWHLARGEDRRSVTAHAPVRGISNETTFSEDTSDPDILDGHIWRMADKVSGRMKAKGVAGRVVSLKLKRADHTLLTRRRSLDAPTQIADRIYRTARALYDAAGEPGPFRLLGVGLGDLHPAVTSDPIHDLLDHGAPNRARAERAADTIRARFGPNAIRPGRALR